MATKFLRVLHIVAISIFFFSNQAAATVSVNSSSFITGVYGIEVLNRFFDVEFVYNTEAARNENSNLWGNQAEFNTAVSALLQEMNTVNSYIVQTSDGNLVNNDFLMINTSTSAVHIRRAPPSMWFVYSENAPMGMPIMASFTDVTPVPEPETYAMLLVGLGLIGGIALRKKQQ